MNIYTDVRSTLSGIPKDFDGIQAIPAGKDPKVRILDNSMDWWSPLIDHILLKCNQDSLPIILIAARNIDFKDIKDVALLATTTATLFSIAGSRSGNSITGAAVGGLIGGGAGVTDILTTHAATRTKRWLKKRKLERDRQSHQERFCNYL